VALASAPYLRRGGAKAPLPKILSLMAMRGRQF